MVPITAMGDGALRRRHSPCTRYSMVLNAGELLTSRPTAPRFEVRLGRGGRRGRGIATATPGRARA